MNQRLTQKPAGDSPPDLALYWMMRKMSGEMDAAERKSFADWLSASPENEREFTKVERMLDRVDAGAEELLAEDFERELAEQAAPKRQDSRTGMSRIAATLAAIAFAAIIALSLRGGLTAQPAAYATAIGQSQTVRLEDGSEVELNTASRITVAYRDGKRNVELQAGEAFFSVEKDRSRPFIVKTRQAEIAVTGTSFSVSTDHDRSIINVLTGVVDVAPLEGQSATLLAGDTIEVDGAGFIGPVTRYDPSLVLAWRSGKARFRDAPLGDVVATLNRYFVTPIVLGDDSLAALPVTGEFDIRDRATAIKALALIFNLDSREEPARAVLTRPEIQ
jgi:transmembrane sensor